MTRCDALPARGAAGADLWTDPDGAVNLRGVDGPSVFVRPGDWVFAQGRHRLHTILGSSVSIVLWVPRLQLGGMCHYLLPERPSPPGLGRLDGRFGVEACAWLEARLRGTGMPWAGVEASVAGGSGRDSDGIGSANVAWAQEWAVARGLRFIQQDVGGRVVRRLSFNLADGALAIEHGGRLDEGPA